MKNILLITAFAFSGIFISSCSKDSDDNPQNDSETVKLLTAGSWIETDAIWNGKSLWDLKEDCLKDNTLTYLRNGVLLGDEGATKCKPDDPQENRGNWVLINNETQMIHSEGGKDPDTLNIHLLNSTELVYSGIFSNTDTIFIFFKHL